MHIAGMTIGEVPPFTTGVEFKFHEQVNLFIGPNATGKSSLLRWLMDLWKGWIHDEDIATKFHFSADWPRLRPYPNEEAYHHQPLEFPDLLCLPVITIPAARVGYNLRPQRTPRRFLIDTERLSTDSERLDRERLLDEMLGRGYVFAHKHNYDFGFDVRRILGNPIRKVSASGDSSDSFSPFFAERVQLALNMLLEEAEEIALRDPNDHFDERTLTRTFGDDFSTLLDDDLVKLTSQIASTTINPSTHSGDMSPSSLASSTGVSIDKICTIIAALMTEDRLNSTLDDDLEKLCDIGETAKFWTEIPSEDILMYASHPITSRSAANILKAVNVAYACSKRICDEAIDSAHPERHIIASENTSPLTGAASADARVEHGIVITTSDSRSLGRFPDELSAGTEGTIWWIRHLALNMVHHYGYKFGWEKQPAVLLIDEIENHLHPTWQRRVIPALLEHFPGLQIFATTHSPFVVAGLKGGQVHLLNRDADGVVTSSTNTEDIVGWTADEILRTMMGVEDPTDEGTAAAARELRQLRDEGPRDSVEAEAKRDARMHELRRLVDRDLLAGGAAAAQRELFEQQFAEALEKYRQSQDMGLGSS